MSETSGCIRCGQCCISAHIALYSVTEKHDPQEFARWLTYHGLQVSWRELEKGKEKVLTIRIPIICKHLKIDDNGVASCRIYDERPQICKDHLCIRARTESTMPSVLSDLDVSS